MYKSTYISSAVRNKIRRDKWPLKYETTFVSYGTLVMAVYEYRSEIQSSAENDFPPN
jgi:hypothetical protein